MLIFAHDFPAYLEMQVTMKRLGAPPDEAIEITTINTKESGSFFKIFYIPAALVGEPLIEIDLDGIKSIYTAENIFINETFIDDEAVNLSRDIIRMAEIAPEAPPGEAQHGPLTLAASDEELEETPAIQDSAEPESEAIPSVEAQASEWIYSGDPDAEHQDPVPFVWPAVLTWLSGYNFTEAHPGIDIAAKEDDLIFAAASGKVVRVNHSNVWYGNMVLIEHQNGYQTLYAHLNTILVELGNLVLQGQPIGLAGSTGNSTGVHLHFEIRYQGEFVNPWFYFDN